VGDPLAYVFQKLHLTKMSGVIAISAVIAMASVLLVFQVGQPRIWMSMSRDGLLPPSFSKIHRKYRTPWFATIITGILVAIPSLFMNLTEVTDLTSIGTLFAFVLVSGGVLVLESGWKRDKTQNSEKGFRIPYFNSRYFLPFIWLGILILLWFWNPDETRQLAAYLTGNSSSVSPATAISSLLRFEFPVLLFIVLAILITFFSIRNQLSLIPVLGLLTNFYLMAQLGVTNWLRFLVWLLLGLAIYFLYSRRHSKLKNI
jgi:APA family basic amino acid/polyamine antiporter